MELYNWGQIILFWNDMNTVKIVAAIIIHENRIFATQRGYGELKDGWEFPGGRSSRGRRRRRRLCGKLGKNWLPADQGLIEGIREYLQET